MRALVALGTALAALFAAATPAEAAFDVTPLACTARPQPTVADPRYLAALAVFGYHNPNAGPVDIPYGGDNIVLQPPYFPADMTWTFLPGTHEVAWYHVFLPTAQPVLQWVLDSAIAGTEDAVCGGPMPPDPLPAPTLGSGSSAAVGDALAVAADRTGDGIVLTAIERCHGRVCALAADLDNTRVPRTSYTVSPDDAGYEVRLIAIRVTMRGWTSALSARVSVPGPATAPPPQEPVDPTAVAPEPLRQPTVSGTAGGGFTLTADPGRWAGAPQPSLDVRWQRCDPAGCADIAGATGNEYVPGADDAGQRLRAVVSATATGLTAFAGSWVTETAASEPTSPITPAPLLQSAPVIAGQPDVGSPLTLTDPGRFDANVARTVQWQSCAAGDCRDVPGAAGTSYEVRPADAGRKIRAAVTATTPGGRTVAVSNRIGPAGAVRSTAAPRVLAGTGSELWTDGGRWAGTPAPGLSFEWLRCDAAGDGCVAIPGATAPGYAPAAADRGGTLRARVTAGNGFSSATATSAPSARIERVEAAAGAADRTRPVVSHLTATPQRFRRSTMLTTLSPVHAPRVRKGTIVSVRLSEDAWVRVDVARRHAGHRRTLATLTKVLRAGDHRLRFTGRLPRARGGKLEAGGYALEIRATDAAGNVSRQRVVRIRIVR
jgi:hypothetical protein